MAEPVGKGGLSDPVGKPGASPGDRGIGVGIFGLGTVGTAVWRLLAEGGPHLARQIGAPLRVRRVVVRHPDRPRGVTLPPGVLSTDPEAILGDPEIDIVVEVMGGLEPAREYVATALARGKSVVTANKELISYHGHELLSLAAAAGVDLFWEASVGGGIPIIRPLREHLAPGRLRRLLGIVNGTTNFILTRMAREGQTFAAALADAQAAGYAEADPRADVEGHDAARKLAILAGMAFHAQLSPDEIPTVGITGITPVEIAWGQGRGLTLKLVAQAERLPDGTVMARVEPAFLPLDHPLARVEGAMNAIWVEGVEIGETLFYGPGAGGLPTATAVIADLLEAARHRRLGIALSRPWAEGRARVAQEPPPRRYYLRLEPGAVGSGWPEPLAAPVSPVAARVGGATSPREAVAARTEPAGDRPGPGPGPAGAAWARQEAAPGLAPAAQIRALAERFRQHGLPVVSAEPLPGGGCILEVAEVTQQEMAAALAKASDVVGLAIQIPILG
ncbi:MAG: homoserine dehydrogenase [Firmicutes bacterium]|nr:homoserine dehydrogenase [Bacillota bacterium]